MSRDVYEKIINLGKRRGIIFPAFEIYGGVSGFFDYGPIGTVLKRNIEEKWRKLFVYNEGMVEIESTLIMPSQVYNASGHLAHFTDIMTKCSKCTNILRTDKLLTDIGIENAERLKTDELDRLIEKNDVRCPKCNGQLTKSEPFNLMFQVEIGTHSGSMNGFCRPEAAQGQFLAFKRIYLSERERLPLGIAQIGRCARNEIAPRKGPIRLREFTIIDFEIFVDPDNLSYPKIKYVEHEKLRLLVAQEQLAQSSKIMEITVKEALEKGIIKNQILGYFMVLASKFLNDLGIPENKQRFREALPDERAHYSQQTFDQEVWLQRWGWTEVSGHAYRTDYDLRNHMTCSGVDLRVYKAFDKPKKVAKNVLKPKMDVIEKDYGALNAQIIANLLSKSDHKVICRELNEKGFYELMGQHLIKLESKHIDIIVEEMVESGRKFIPHVVEPSFGVDRILYAVLEYAYLEKKKRVILELPLQLAPVQIYILPLVTKNGLPEKAREIFKMLLDESLTVIYDESDSIGRRYARADEIGVPICITIDYLTLEDDTVTLRDIKSWQQVRINSRDLPNLLRKYFKNKLRFDQLGKPL
ncbi:MAG: glycine--tRNA ligase [Candidatus Bathyarchaeota archaeon]|nr:MAG: glycine--tRNA ligase [Candidatus Bathyarchaeota archaeon]